MAITYFVTGANRGIGFEFAKQLSEDSNNIVFATTRSLANATALKSLKRSNLHIVELDLTSSKEELSKALEKAIPKVTANGVDIVIQNGGISKSNGIPLLETSADSFREHFEVNTIGPVKLYQAIYKFWALKENPETIKKFIFISSEAGTISNPPPFEVGSYGVSKAALNLVVRLLAMDHSGFDLDYIKKSVVVAFHPGVVRTDMASDFIDKYSELLSQYKVYEPEDSAANLIKVTKSLKTEDTSSFFNVEGGKSSW